MSKELYYKNTIKIKAPKSKVWDALINPEITKNYMFGCEAVSDWKVGSRLDWKGAADGVVYVTGVVKAFEPEDRLALTTFDPNSGQPDIPENHVLGEYKLSEVEGGTQLDVTQGDFGKFEDGETRLEHTKGSWEMALNALKNVCES